MDRDTSGEEDDQVWEDMDIVPLVQNRPSENEAHSHGYSTKLVSNWYRHVCSANSCPPRWSEFDNVDADEADLMSRTLAVPIIHRFIRHNNHWITRDFTIQDPSMRLVLADILKKYQDLDLELESWTFSPPFMPLVHRWEELKKYQSEAVTPSLKNAASVLQAFLTPTLASSVVSLAHTQKTGKVSFDDAWLIFSPGSIVSTKLFGVEALTRIVKYQKRERTQRQLAAWIVDMEYVDWNGQHCGFTTTTLTIEHFKGYRRVTELPVFPISHHSNEDSIRAAALSRGRKFEQVRGYHFMFANGTKILLETEEYKKRAVAGRVCIDAYAYYRSRNLVRPKLRPLWGDQVESDGMATDDIKMPGTGFETGFKAVNVNTGTAAKSPVERVEDLRILTGDLLLLTIPWVKGFDLKSKDWCMLRVDQLKEMTWNDDAFEKLVLPGDEKHLAWDFVESKGLAKAGFDDFIPDKGRGLIILMFGPPGVGKTFTAEAVAEKSRVPLYAMSAGDLGTKPADVEQALERALELCRMWNAMLLLDEADVFLGARTAESLARNELVAIFLRKLEYYQGILFMTTNRMSSIDHAFQSRVDLFLPYHDLSTEARREVWRNFIERAGRNKFDFDDEEAALEKLAGLDLNGREIKNLIKSAQLLSCKSGAKVPMDRLYMLADKRVQALKMLG
ncbi:hypothetical protein F5Y15DRAFT_386114 [Xylariaceae sp. FL0016]|nr:hypothetical protein F5Y15DRAFT_386114 [Xylariaceae sp. FL0016]